MLASRQLREAGFRQMRASSLKGKHVQVLLRRWQDEGLSGQAQKHFWCGGRPYGFRLKPVLDPARLDVYGQPARIGTVLEIDSEQAVIARERFARFVDGELPGDLAGAERSWRSKSWFGVEAQDTSVHRLDGLRSPRNSEKPAVLRQNALERLAVRCDAPAALLMGAGAGTSGRGEGL